MNCPQNMFSLLFGLYFCSIAWQFDAIRNTGDININNLIIVFFLMFSVSENSRFKKKKQQVASQLIIQQTKTKLLIQIS